MSLPVASLDPIVATLILSILVLCAGTVLSGIALCCGKEESAKQVFAIVGVLFGLLAAGGLGTLFAGQNAETAERAAETAATATEGEVSSEVTSSKKNCRNCRPAKARGPASSSARGRLVVGHGQRNADGSLGGLGGA